MTAEERQPQREALRITVPKKLALDCQQVLEQQGVPLNVTQSVKAMLQYAIQTKTKAGAASSAVEGKQNGLGSRG